MFHIADAGGVAMSWLDRLTVEENSRVEQRDQQLDDETRMSPGLTGEYDWDLREKAGVHTPPPPPEFMGLEGEYDTCGLAKRVAIALDQTPEIDDIETLSIVQAGSTIRLMGDAPNQETLERMVEAIAKVDGTKAVDTHKVKVLA
jgi:hypothetical protein